MHKKPKVLFMDAAPWSGGAQLSLLELITAFTHQGGQAALLTADQTPNGLRRKAAELDIPVFHLPARHWRFNLRGFAEFAKDRPQCRLALNQALGQFQPQIIHTNSSRAALLSLNTRDTGKIPLLLHARDLREPAPVKWLLGRRVECVLAISECVAKLWRSTLAENKVELLHNGFNLELLREQASPAQTCWHEPGLCRIILAADFTPWKNHRLFLESLNLAGNDCPELRAVIVGRTRTPGAENYLRELQKTAQKLKISDRLDFVTDTDNAMPWIAGADLLVSAAAAEPFGRTVVEALALGKPVVAVKDNGPEEILTGCSAGTVCAATAPALASAILSWRAPERRRNAAQAAQTRAADFTTEPMIAKLNRIYAACT